MKHGGSETRQGGLSTSPSALSTHWSRAREGKMKSRKEEESQVVRGGQGHRTCWDLTFTLREMVSHCRLLSRGVPRDELYVNRSSVAALLWENHRDRGRKLGDQTGGSRIIQAGDNGREDGGAGKGRIRWIRDIF